MKFSVRKTIDRLGRIVIPKELREYYGFDVGAMLKLIPTDSGILLTKAESNENEANGCENKSSFREAAVTAGD